MGDSKDKIDLVYENLKKSVEPEKINSTNWRVVDKKNKFLSYEEAEKFVHSLGIKSSKEWKKYCESGKKPNNIPCTPRLIYKNKGWVSDGKFLGTNSVASHLVEFLPYEEAEKFVHSLGLKDQKEWKEYYKSGNRPKNIPTSPESVYKNKGWISLGKFLGTNIIAHSNREFFSYEEAEKFVHSVGLKNVKDWKKYSKTNNKPHSIPVCPDRVYKNKGWISWGKFLGTNTIATHLVNFIPYKEAEDFVKKLNLKGSEDWRKYCESGKKPNNIPADPHAVYKNKGWVSSGKFLGTNFISNRKREYLSYEEVEKIIHSLELENEEEWREYCKSGSKPKNIPGKPSIIYKNKGWVSWGKFLRINFVNEQLLPYEEAEKFVHSLKLKDTKEWIDYCKSAKKPKNIPASPHVFYKNKGWVSVGKFLGTNVVANSKKEFSSYEEAKNFAQLLNIKSSTEWKKYYYENEEKNMPLYPHIIYKNKGWISWYSFLNKKNYWTNIDIATFLKSIESELTILEAIELITIIEQSSVSKRLNKNDDFRKLLGTAPNSFKRKEVLSKIIKNYDNNINEDSLEDLLEQKIKESEDINESIDLQNILPQFDEFEDLKAYDNHNISSSMDEESAKFLLKYRISKLWNKALSNKVDINKLKEEIGGPHFTFIKESFLEELEDVQSISIPQMYSFKDKNNKILPPNLMQRLTAHRLSIYRRYGNWSGAGAGKTLSAIFSSRVIQTKKNLIITYNSAINTWKKTIEETFPDSKIYFKENKNCTFNDSDYNYLILNYEQFQLEDSQQFVYDFLKNNNIEFVVLDEVQGTKQTTEEICSKRRKVISGLLDIATYKNPELYVLAMSATPVINNLYEPKVLLEMLKGEKYDDLKIFHNVNNAIAIHRQMILNGIRFIPEYDISIKTKTIDLDGSHLVGKLYIPSSNDILKIEQIQLQDKLLGVKDYLKKGTVIYSHYVEGIIEPTKKYLENKGFKVGIFTGDQKDGLEKFKNGEVDILIGSSAIATGVDGIQKVCDRIICLTLPFTSSEFDQLKGRIFRQGSNFLSVDIIIPVVKVYYKDGTDSFWSWDKIQIDRIKYKKTLADVAVDGVIPDSLMPSRKKLLAKSMEALKDWVDRVEKNELIIIDRERTVLLNEEQIIKIFTKNDNLNLFFDSFDNRSTELDILSTKGKIFQKNIPLKVVKNSISKKRPGKEFEITKDLSDINKNVKGTIATVTDSKNPSTVFINISFWISVKIPNLTTEEVAVEFKKMVKKLQNIYRDSLMSDLRNNKFFPLHEENIYTVDYPIYGFNGFNGRDDGKFISIELNLHTLNCTQNMAYALSKTTDTELFNATLQIYNKIVSTEVLLDNNIFNIYCNKKNSKLSEKINVIKNTEVVKENSGYSNHKIKVIRSSEKIVIKLDDNTTFYLENNPEKYESIKTRYIDKYLKLGYTLEQTEE